MFRLGSLLHCGSKRRAKESAEADRADARQAAARFSRGNIPIQHGAFVTSEDLERERQELTKHPLP